MKIWQNSINNMVQKVHQTISSTSDNLSVEGENEEWKEEAVRQGKLAELRWRIKQVEEEMKVVEEGEEDGPVVNLVRLSQKVKALVKGLLIESEYC